MGPHLEGRGRAKLLLRAFLSSPQDIKVGWGGHMTMPRQEIPLHLLLRGQLQSPTHRLKVPLLLRLRERYFVRPMTTPLWPPPTCRKQWHLETCGEETMTLESSGRRTLDQVDTLDGNNTSPALPGRLLPLLQSAPFALTVCAITFPVSLNLPPHRQSPKVAARQVYVDLSTQWKVRFRSAPAGTGYQPNF